MAGRRIGLIAGAGDLPHVVIEGARQSGDEIFVAPLSGFATAAEFDTPAREFGFGQIGGLIKYLKKQNCSHISFAGNVRRPDFSQIKPDFRGVRLLPKVIKAAARGDDALLSFLMSVFEEEGFSILAPQELAAHALMTSGALGQFSPTPDDKADIEFARKIAADIGALDIGQGAIVCRGLVLATEAQEGTDAMLARICELPENIRGRAGGAAGILAKRLKPGQDPRADLPTIGPRTIRGAAQAHLAGIVLETGGAFILRRDECRALADELGIFVFGHDGD